MSAIRIFHLVGWYQAGGQMEELQGPFQKFSRPGRKTTQAVQACVEALVDAAPSPDWMR